jgi:hypothetical protein
MRAPVTAPTRPSGSCSEILQSFPAKPLRLLYFRRKTAADNSEKTAEKQRHFCNEQRPYQRSFCHRLRLPEPRPSFMYSICSIEASMSSPANNDCSPALTPGHSAAHSRAQRRKGAFRWTGVLTRKRSLVLCVNQDLCATNRPVSPQGLFRLLGLAQSFRRPIRYRSGPGFCCLVKNERKRAAAFSTDRGQSHRDAGRCNRTFAGTSGLHAIRRFQT